jgi:O-antigen ligase
MDKFAYCALLVLTFFVPWDNSIAIEGLGSFARVVGLGVLALSLLSITASGNIRRPHPFHVVAVAFVIWSACTLLWAINYDATFERTATYMQVGVLAWLIWQHARTERRQRALFASYVLGAYVTALGVMRNYFLGVTMGGTEARYTASGFNSNEAAFVLALGMPIAWYLALRSTRRATAIVYSCYLLVAIVAVVLTGSRGAFVSLVIALMLIPWSLSRVSLRARLSSAVLLVAAMSSASALVPTVTYERLGATARNIQQGDFGGREALWSAGVELFLDDPVSGVGAGGYQYATRPLGFPSLSHQTFLEVLTGQGLVGLLLFLGMFIAAFHKIPGMPALERKFWVVLVATLFVGLLPRTYDDRKPLWFLLGLATAQSALVRRDQRLITLPDRTKAGAVNTVHREQCA